MKRLVILVSVLLTSLVSAAWVQQPASRETGQNNRPVYYDTFNEKWLNPTKWLPDGGCGGWSYMGLDCAREIQDGHLRLAVRNFGAPDSDYSDQYFTSELNFVNPNAINSISGEVTLRSFSGVGCSTNNTDSTHGDVQIGGNFFNPGTGDDVYAVLYLWVDTNNPRTIYIWNYNTSTGITTDVANYPVGTPLTFTFAWDKANHQFIAAVKAKDDPGPANVVVAPYFVSDTMPPTNPKKSLHVDIGALNCTSGQTFAQVEAFFDKVMVNVPLPRKE